VIDVFLSAERMVGRLGHFFGEGNRLLGFGFAVRGV
jgi:hypothetical protein